MAGRITLGPKDGSLHGYIFKRLFPALVLQVIAVIVGIFATQFKAANVTPTDIANVLTILEHSWNAATVASKEGRDGISCANHSRQAAQYAEEAKRLLTALSKKQ